MRRLLFVTHEGRRGARVADARGHGCRRSTMSGRLRCVVCLRAEEKNPPFPHKPCPKCGETTYCSLACRKAHWPKHRARCRLAVMEQAWNAGDAHNLPLPPKGEYYPPQSYVPPRGWGQATMEVASASERQRIADTLRTAGGLGGSRGAPAPPRGGTEPTTKGQTSSRSDTSNSSAGGYTPPGGWGQATLVKAPQSK